MDRLDPPGFLDDMTEDEKQQWSALVSSWLDEAVAGNPAENDGPRAQFFNPLTTPPAADQTVAVIAWSAFPRQVASSALSDRHRWRRADSSRNLQDEYCEWSVTRDPATQKITRVTFTCEGPEYWNALAILNPEKVLELYREFISPAITFDDLFENGQYNPFNLFNNSTTNGAMHLIQPANSLHAEIELGAAATIRRIRDGAELTDAQELIRCSLYGAPGRNSDPHIGERVNALARQGADITINNPVGLYLHAFNPVGWATPDGEDARTFWKFVRGRDDHFVRAVYEVPADKDYVVGDLTIDGRNIEFGAQIVDFITIKLEGLATRVGASTVEPFQGCRGASPQGAAPPAAPANARAALPTMPLRSRTEASAAAGGVANTPAMAGAAPPNVMRPAGEEAAAAAEETLMTRLPEAIRQSLGSQRDDDGEAGAAPPALRPYPRLPLEKFHEHLVTGKIMAYASPDSTYAVTKQLLDSAQRSIVIGIYDFNADYMMSQLKKAMQRGVRVSLMLDTKGDTERSVFRELSELGAECVKAPSSSAGNSIAYFNNAHEKIIVVDSDIVMIQSGNWSENSIPFNEGDGVVTGQFAKGNRDMGIAVQSRELAKFFAELVARDMRLAQGLPPDAAGAAPPDLAAADAAGAGASEIFFEAAPPAIPDRLFSSLTIIPSEPVSITPAVTPENFHETARDFLRSARRSIRIEQQYVRNQAAIRALMDEIQGARNDHPNLDIRIIVSPKYMDSADRTALRTIMRDFDLEFDDNYRLLSPRHFVHCHNKLIVVDEEQVLVGSQNWSTTGVLSNREAGLLVKNVPIATYFAQIFDADWQMSEPTAAPPDAVSADAVAGLAKPSDFAQGGVLQSSIRDYIDV